MITPGTHNQLLGLGETGETPVLSRNGKSPIAHQVPSRGGVLFVLKWVLFYFLLISKSWAHSELLLPTIVKSGSSSDVLTDDSVVSRRQGRISQNSGSGTIGNTLQNQLGFSISDYGQAGAASQLRGLGASAEDIDVQAFGLSLNPPQGGGFDLSAFPQYLWSEYRFQSGPPQTSMNPTAIAGTLNLVPWTVDRLNRGTLGAQAGAYTSSAGIHQVSAGAYANGKVAVIGGYSTFRAQGPSGGLSARWLGNRGSLFEGRIHLLASDLDTEAPLEKSFPNAGARLRKVRMIPVLENDWIFGSEALWKNSIFFDYTQSDYDNPASRFHSFTQTKQWGTRNTVLLGSWRLGAGFRQVQFLPDSGMVPLQSMGNLLAAYDWEPGAWLVQPTIQSVWVNDFGWVPEGSLGIRHPLGSKRVVGFAKATYSRRIPSLMDRYSPLNEMNFVGNQALKPETDWTGTLGAEVKEKSWDAAVEGYAQLRKDSRVVSQFTTINFGDAHVISLTASGRYSPLDWLDLTQRWILTRSQLTVTGNPFPYLPSFSAVAGFRIYSPDQGRKWEWSTYLRFNGERTSLPDSAAVLPAYVVVDSGVQWSPGLGIRLGARVENIFDRYFEIVKGYPIGRNISLLVSGEI